MKDGNNLLEKTTEKIFKEIDKKLEKRIDELMNQNKGLSECHRKT